MSILNALKPLIVNAKNYSFSYPGEEEKTIDGVSFEIRRGEVIGLVGSTGSGKTTLSMTIAGVAPDVVGGEDSGHLHVAGHYRTQDEDSNGHRGGDSNNHRRSGNTGEVGMVFENYGAQLVELQVLPEVKTPLINRGLSEDQADNEARQLLNKVGMGGQDLEKRQTWELSGGQQQRLAIAATLAMDPQIIIFDNVLDRLDPQGQLKVKNIITELAATDKTLIVVEKDPYFLMEITHRLLVLVDGQIVAEGAPNEILRNYDLLELADIEPPLTIAAARGLGICEPLFTAEEFEQAVSVNFTQIFKPSYKPQDLNGSSSRTQNNFGQPLLCMEDVTFCYSENNKALTDMHLTLREGEVHALIGASGAGKTTTVKLINGLLKPSSGKVLVCDQYTSARNATELAWKVGTVFQNPDEVISERTTKDEIAFPLKQRQYESTGWFSKQKRYEDNQIEDWVREACDLAGIDQDLFDCDPTLLPRGLRKLVTIAEALVLDPAVLLLDEPSADLGAKDIRKLKQTIAKLSQKGKAVLLVSNDVNLVAEVADTVTVLNQGRIVFQDSWYEVFAQKNWDHLSELHLCPPRAAHLAQRFGITALSCEELVSKLSSIRKEA